jgi:CHAT domain-containing protein/tetratricopeptide (TPR) repeat protein
MRRAVALLLLLAAFARCTVPSPRDLVGGQAVESPVSLGADARGEACNQQQGEVPGAVSIYCGDWNQPAGHVRVGGLASPDTLLALATTSSWRAGLNLRFACTDAIPTNILDDMPAIVLHCIRRAGGWPQVAIAASAGGTVYLADGIVPVLPVLERSIGTLSGRLPQDRAPLLPPSVAMSQLIDRLAAHAFRVGDVAEYDRLMALGVRANLAEDFASAAVAYRAALALLQKALGRDNPNTAAAIMQLALQLSNLGRFDEAAPLFANAERLVPMAADLAAPAHLQHDEALDRINQDRFDEALFLLAKAEAAYTPLVPPEALAVAPSHPGVVRPSIGELPSERLLTDPTAQSALMGIVEVRRYRAIVQRELRQPAEAAATMRSADDLAETNAIMQPIVAGRVLRTIATTSDEDAFPQEASRAGNRLDASVTAFRSVLPLTRPEAVTNLLLAAAYVREGDEESAIARCRDAAKLLRTLKLGVEPALLEPCLTALMTMADRLPAERSRLLVEMFELSELAQSSITSELIEEAAARLAEGNRSPSVATAMRRRQDASEHLAALYQERETLTARRRPGAPPYVGPPIEPRDLDKLVADAQAELADSDSVLQETAPNYGQLVQQSVPAADVQAGLKPREAFASIMVGKRAGWTFLLRDGHVMVGHSADATDARLKRLVGRVRTSVSRVKGELRPYDTASAQAIYDVTLGTVAAGLTGVQALVVAPSGPLLALPFSILLTKPTDPTNLADADWLIHHMQISHVPAAANFVALRRAGVSHAPKAWFGMGDFEPVTLAQARRSFPSAACGESAESLVALNRLPFARKELDEARGLYGASASDELLGTRFTADAVRRAALKDYRLVHFAAHAMLPFDLNCLDEPVIVTSPPVVSKEVSGALLTAADVIDIDLDADAVVLSACNSGSPEGKLSGESLSALARAFFYAGARSLMATHWYLNDRAGWYLTTNTLRHLRAGTDGGLAGSLRATQLELLAEAGKSEPVNVAHPYFWGPFAVIGEDGGSGLLADVASP